MTNHPPEGGPAVVFRDVVKVYHPCVRAAVAMPRWRREATAAA